MISFVEPSTTTAQINAATSCGTNAAYQGHQTTT